VVDCVKANVGNGSGLSIRANREIGVPVGAV
jgi:hypothetical protein